MNTETDKNIPKNEESSSYRSKRTRSSPYPSYIINKCFDLVQDIDTEFTDVVYTPQEDIVNNVGKKGGAFLMFLGSCVQYNLLDLKKGEGYKPSALFKKISRPLPNENVDDLYKECLLEPNLYKSLINEFNNKALPSKSGLANILVRNYNIKSNAADKAATIFIKNLNELGCIKDGNILYLNSVKANKVEEIEDDSTIIEEQESIVKDSQINTPSTSVTTQTNQLLLTESTNHDKLTIKLTEGKHAYLSFPNDINVKDIEILKLQIESLSLTI
ncbi:MAG: hypothetical protein R2800_03965 [Flavipsychrobacter sp.]